MMRGAFWPKVRYPLAMIAAIVIGLAAVLAAIVGRGFGKEHLRALVWSDLPRPAPTGPSAVGFATLSVPGNQTFGEFTADLFYPSRAEAKATRMSSGLWWFIHPTHAAVTPDAPLAVSGVPASLILYMPSGFSTRGESSFTLANLASHGFIVAAIDDVVHIPLQGGADTEAQRAILDFASEATFARSRILSARRVVLEAQAGSLVIDALGRSDRWRHMIDTTHVGVLGFSFGGGAAAALSRLDARIGAVANLDGSLYGESAHLGVDAPYLVLFADTPFHPAEDFVQPDLSARFDAILDQEEIERQRRDAGRAAHWTFVVKAMRHEDFSDRLIVPTFTDRRTFDGLSRAEAWTAIASALTNFFEAALLHPPPIPFDTGALSDKFETLAQAEAAVLSPARAGR